MPWAGWLGRNPGRPQSLPEGAGLAYARNAKSYGWRNPLHHSERRAIDGHARLGETARRAERRQLEAGALYPQPASTKQAGAATASVRCKIGALHRLAILREVPRANLRTLAQDADGECGARSARAS